MSIDYMDIEKVHRIYLMDPCAENLDMLMEACKSLIFHYARIYGGGCCFEDITQAGYVGLVKATKNFDEKKGIRFTTYASHSIIGEIRHFVRKERKYYYPNCLASYQEKLDDIIESSIDDGDEQLTEDVLAAMVNLQPEGILPVMSAGLVHLNNLEIANIKNKAMESFTLPIEDKLFVSQLVYHLTAIQKDVIEMLFSQGMTQEEVANELGLTQKQVSRIKQKSLQKMRTAKKEE